MMDRRRRNFAVALTLYVGWVLGLGALAWSSSDRPRPRPSAPAAR